MKRSILFLTIFFVLLLTLSPFALAADTGISSAAVNNLAPGIRDKAELKAMSIPLGKIDYIKETLNATAAVDGFEPSRYDGLYFDTDGAYKLYYYSGNAIGNDYFDKIDVYSKSLQNYSWTIPLKNTEGTIVGDATINKYNGVWDDTPSFGFRNGTPYEKEFELFTDFDKIERLLIDAGVNTGDVVGILLLSIGFGYSDVFISHCPGNG